MDSIEDWKEALRFVSETSSLREKGDNLIIRCGEILPALQVLYAFFFENGIPKNPAIPPRGPEPDGSVPKKPKRRHPDVEPRKIPKWIRDPEPDEHGPKKPPIPPPDVVDETSLDDSEPKGSIIVYRDIPDGESNDLDLRSLGRYGHRLRLTCLFGWISNEALSHIEARRTAERLLKYQPLTTGENAALFIWYLVLLTARHYDHTVRATLNDPLLLDLGATDSLVVGIRSAQQRIFLELRHPLQNLPEPTGPLAAPVSDTFNLNLVIPPNANVEEALRHLGRLSTTKDIDQLIEDKRSIARSVKDHVDRFTETRLRGCLVEGHFQSSYDYPATQLLFGESLGTSFSSLSYYAATEHELQNGLNSAIRKLYGDQLQLAENPSQLLVGAPKAGYPIEVLRPHAHYINNIEVALKNTSLSWTERHNLLCRQLAMCLTLSSAHRNTIDLDTLRRDDISLWAGIALFRDKPSDPSIFRRIAALSTIAIQLLSRYLSHIINANENNTAAEIPEHIREALTSATKSTGPLLFIAKQKQIESVCIRTLFNSLSPEIEPNITRHLQCNWLRPDGAEPLLIEAHLGHHFSEPIFGEYGVVSPIELSRELTPHLDNWLNAIGVIPPEISRQAIASRDISPHDIDIYIAEEKRSDAKQLLKFLRSEYREGVTARTESSRFETITEIVDEAINQVAPGWNNEHLTLPIVVSKKEALIARAYVASAIASNTVSIITAVRRLHRRLRKMHIDKILNIEELSSITFDIRPPLVITRGHFAAYELISHLRQQFLRALENDTKPNLYRYAQVSLVLFGDCDRFRQASAWMAASKNADPIKGEAFMIIDPDDTDGASRTVSGIPYLLISAWKCAKCPSSKGTILKQAKLPPHSAIEAIAREARYIEHPQMFADVISGRCPQKELSGVRLRDLLFDRVGVSHKKINSLNAPLPVREMHKYEKNTATQMASDYRTLRNLVLEPPRARDAKGPKTRSSVRAIRHWLNNSSVSPLILLLAEWATTLLKPGANLKNTGELRLKTVFDYLQLAWLPLSRSVANDNLAELGSDELAELIEDNLSTNKDLRNKQLQALHRLFSDMSKSFELPKLMIPRPGDSPLEIDAGIVTPAEHAYTKLILNQWQADEKLDATALGALKDAELASDFYSALGPRRNELSLLRSKDATRFEDVSQILIRPHPDRTIKTNRSKRVLIVEREYGEQLYEQSNLHAFPHLATPSGHYAGMNALTSALRYAAGNLAARIHYYRHTCGSVGINIGITTQNPIERIRHMTKMSAQLGHASTRTTMTHYGHTFWHAMALRRIHEIDDLENRVYTNVFPAEDPADARKRRHRSKQRKVPLITEHTRKIGIAAGKHQATKPRTKPPLPIFLTKDSDRTLTINVIGTWLLRYARGESVTRACRGLTIGLKQLILLVAHTRTLEIQLMWQPIELSTLSKDLTLLEESCVAAANPPTRKKLPQGWLDTEIHGLRDHPGAYPDDFTNQLRYISWRGRNPLTLGLDDAGIQSTNRVLSKLGSTLQITKMDNVDKSNGRNAVFTSSYSIDKNSKYFIPQHLESHATRFIIFVVLLSNLSRQSFCE